MGQVEPAVEAWLEAALVCEESIGDLGRAADVYERVLAASPGHRRALFALGLVLHDLQRWNELVALYRRRIAESEDEGERVTLAQFIAEVLAEKLDDPNGAFETLMAAAGRDPHNLRALCRLEKLAERTGRLAEVAIVIGDMLMHQEDRELRAALGVRLADLYLGPLGDPGRALVHARSALFDAGGDPELLQEVGDVFRERARFDQWAALLEELVEDGRVQPHRVVLERELARIYEVELDDRPRALEAVARALEVVPDDRSLVDEVLRLGLTGGDLGAVARIFERVLAATTNRMLATYLRLKLGHLYARVLERPEDARRAYLDILDDEPEHREALRRLAALDRAPLDSGSPGAAPNRRRPPPLPPAELRAGESEPDATDLSVDWAWEAPSWVPDVVPISDLTPTGAVPDLDSDPDSDPEDPTVWAPGGLEPVGERPADGVVDAVDEAIALLAEVERRQSTPAALGRAEHLAEVLPIAPRLLAAKTPAPFEADAPSPSERDPASAPPSPRSSGRGRFPLPGRPNRLQVVPPSDEEEARRLELEVEDLDEPERSARRMEAAAAWRRASDPDRAEAVLRAGLREQAGHAGLASALSALLAGEGRWAQWLELALRQVEWLEPASALPLWLQMAEVAAAQLGDPVEAWRFAVEAAAIAPGDPAPLLVLERLARAANDQAGLATALTGLLDLDPLDAARWDALGAVRFEAGQLEQALRAWQSAHRLDPEDHERLARIGELEADLGRIEAAEQRFSMLAERGDPAARARAGVRLAELRLRRPDGGSAAVLALEGAIAADPRHVEAHAMLCDVCEGLGDAPRATALAERCAEIVEEPFLRAFWLRRAGRLADTAVGDRRRALRNLEAALALDPDDPESEARLGELLFERGEFVEAHRRLARAAEGLRDELGAARRFELAAEAAHRAGDRTSALEAYEAALERHPSSARALLAACRLYGESGDLDRAHDRAATLVLHHEDALEPRDRAACFLAMARGKLVRGEAAGAVRWARRAEALRPEDEEPLWVLADGLDGAGEQEEAAEVLRRLADRRAPGKTRAEALAAAAARLGDGPVDRARRVAWLEEALSEAPDWGGLADQLAAARLTVSDRFGAADALEDAAAHGPPSDRAARRIEAAGWLVGHDDGRALRLLRAAWAEDRGAGESVEALEAALGGASDHAGRFDVLEPASRSEAPEAARWRARLAHLAEFRLERPEVALALVGSSERHRAADLLFRSACRPGPALDAARSAWAQRVSESPGDPELMARLAELHQRAGDGAAVRFVLEVQELLHGIPLPNDAPEPGPVAVSVPPDEREEVGRDGALLTRIGWSLVEGLADELPKLRRKDAVGPAALGIRVHRPLERSAAALSEPMPPVLLTTEEGGVMRPGWAHGPVVLVHRAAAEALEETELRFWAGLTLGLLRPLALPLWLFPVAVVRSALLGLGGLAPAPADPEPGRNSRRRGRLVERRLGGTERASAEAWGLDPDRRSLLVARRSALATARRMGLVACGSPAVALAATPPGLERARLLRFCLDARTLRGAAQPS